MFTRSKISLCALGLVVLAGFGLVQFTPAKTQADVRSEETPLLSENERAIFEVFASGDDKALYNALLDAISAEPGAKSSRTERERYAVLCELFNDVASRAANPRKVLYDLDSRPEHEEVDWLRAQAALRAGERDQIAEIEERLGFINGWIVCGPFDNERGAGFESAYPPESVKPNFTDEYAGKSELAVKWRAVTVQPRLGYINLDESMTPDDEVLAYAFTTIEAEKDCDAVLSLACDEGYRIWLNGMPLSTGSANGRNVHRPCTFDQDTFDITLFKGTNTLLLKITEEENAWGFRVRVTGDGLKRASRAEAASWVRRISENPASVPDTIEFKHGVLRDMDERTGDAPSLFWGGLYELFRAPSERKDRVAMHLLEKTHALKLSGNDAAHVCYFLAQASGSTAETKAGTEENRRREMMLETLEHNDRYVPALLWLADYYADTLQIPTRAEEYALRALEAAPGNIAATMALARSYWLRDMRDEYERLCRELLERKPDDSRVYRYLGYFERAAGRKAEALKMYERALLLDASDAYVQRQMLEQLADGDDLEDYSERMTRAHELLPFSTQLYLDEAAVHAGRGDEQKALALLELALEIAPDDDVVLAESARMATRVSDTLRRQAAIEGVTELDGIPAVELAESLRVKALAWLEYALERNPRRADIQRYVQFLRDETPVWEARLQRDIGDLIASKLAEKSPADDIARIVYSDEICHVFADGGSQRFFHIAYKVTNDDGRQALQRYPLRESGDTRVVAARVHKAKDGRVEDSRVERVSTAQFRGLLITNSSLEVGDIFEVRYRIADTQRTFFGDYFGDIASFGHMVPVDVMRATWVLPNKRQFYFYERKASGLQRSESEQDGHRVVTYEGRDIARTEDEPFSPPLMQIAPTVYISTFKDWKSWGAWYWGLIERQVRSTPAIKEQVAELTKGLEREQDIVRAIYNFTVTKIRYNSNWEFGVHGYKPYEAGAIFDRCIGDCKDKAILICAMLREAGIKAYPVIINAEMYRGHEDITLAMPNHFNHCIAYVEYKDGTSRFLDGTTTYSAYDEFPSGDAGANVILIKPDGGVVANVPLPAAEENCHNWTATLTLDVGGNARLTAKNQPKGQAASSSRSWWEVEGERVQLMEGWLGRDVPGAKVSAFEASDLEDLNTPVWWKYEATLPGVVKNENATLVVTPVIQPSKLARSQMGSLAARHNDLLLTPPNGVKSEVMIVPPSGYVPGALPQPVEIKNAFMRYCLSFESIDDGVRMKRELYFDATVVPAADYAAFRADLVKLDTADKTVLSFKKK